MNPFLRSILAFIREHRMIVPGEHVCVGVSGGADSVALFCVLHELKYELGCTLSIAHFDHNLRASSKKDKAFVRRFAQDKGVVLYEGQWGKTQQNKKSSLEQNARRARYQFFQKAARQTKSSAMALGHTKDDQAETVLMRFAKGSGLTGYQGMYPVRKIDGLRILRPFLQSTKSEILKYLKTKKQAYCEDPSNAQLHFTRNRIRLKIMPELSRQLNPQLTDCLARHAELMQTDYLYLRGQSEKRLQRIARVQKNTITIDLEKFQKSHKSLQRNMLRLSCEHLTGSTRQLTFQHIREIEDLLASRPEGSIVHLPKNISITKKHNKLIMTLPKKA